MTSVGIESMNVFCGSACLGVTDLARHRQLDIPRFENLMMKEKTLALFVIDGGYTQAVRLPFWPGGTLES